jgi:hypothetical protein
MTAPQQTQLQGVQQVLDASGQPIQQVPFAQYVVNIGAVQGGALNFAAAGQQAADRIRPLRSPPRDLPRQVRGFLDREQEGGQIGQALAQREVVDLHGPDGTGKTTLVAQALHDQLPTHFPDGTVYLRAAGEAFGDLLQDLIKQFYEVGRDPIHITENEARRYLAGKRALVAIDDADDLEESDAEALIQVLPKSALLVAGREQRLWQGTGVLLRGLPRPQAAALFERYWGQVPPHDRPTVEAICGALHDVPKAIIKTARMARDRNISLSQVLQEVQPQPERRDPMGQVTWMLGFHLSGGERRTLAGLAAPGGSTVGFEALAYVTQIEPEKLRAYLDRLQKMGLAFATDSRYGLDEGLRPYIIDFGVDEEMRARAAHYYLRHAGRLRPRSKDPDEDNVVAALDYYYQRRQWREVIYIARTTDRYLATSGRWASWRKQLEKALLAARQSGDRATEAWAQNQLGVVAVGAGTVAVAQGLFRGALAIWQALGDQAGVTIARWNLRLLLGPPPPPRRGRPEGQPGGGGSALPVALGVTAAVLVVAVITLGVVAFWPDRPTPPPPPPPATATMPPATTVTLPTTTPVPPRIDLGLAAGCGEIFEPGQDLGIQVWSSVDGTVDVSWVDPSGRRESLFGAELRAGETARQPWGAPQAEGRWVLEADLNDGQAADECIFTVEVAPEPLVWVWLEEGCEGIYDPGAALSIRLQSSIDGQATVYLVSPGGQRDRLFRESLQAGQTAARSWEAPDGDGSWVLEAVLSDGPVRDECSFQVQHPQVQIQMDGTCDQEYEPGTQALISLWSNRSGQVDVYLLEEGQRQLLFSQDVVANQASSQYWNVGETQGTWALEADLNNGQASGQCTFSVAAESQPPIIESVWIEPVEDEPICPGDKVWVYAWVFDESGLDRVDLVSSPPYESQAQSPMEVVDDQTYRYPMIAYEEPGTAFYVYAEDVHGNPASSDPESYVVAPCPTIIYDFVEEADNANWYSAAPDYPDYYEQSFPGTEDAKRGYALWLDDPTLEDGSRPGHRVLVTHPSYSGNISGGYNLIAPVNVVIQDGDRFVARVGLLQGASTGDVTFRLRWYSGDPDSTGIDLDSLDDTYDGLVQDWVIPLDSIAGGSGVFYLVVEPNQAIWMLPTPEPSAEPSQTWPDNRAVWVQARIERP